MLAWLGIQEEEEEEVVSVDPPQTPHPQDPSGAAGVDRENGVSAPESPSRFSQGHLADDERPLSDDDDSASSWTMSSDEVVDSPGEAGPDEDPPRRSVVPPLRLDKLPTFEPEQPAPTPTPDPGVFGGLANTVVGWFNTQGDETLPEESDRSGLSEGESDDEGPGLRNLPGVGAAAVSGTEEGVVASSLDGGPEGEQHPEGVHSAGEGERYIGEAVVEEGPYSEEEGEGEAVVEEGPYSEEEGEGEEEEAVVEVPYIGEEPVSFITDDEVSEPNQHAESPLVDSPADAELPSMTHSEGEMNDSDGSETPSGATMIEWAPPSLASVGAAARESLQRLSVIMTGEGGPTLSESVSWTESSQGVEEGEVSGRSEATGFQTDGEKEDEQQQAGLHAEPSSDALGVPTVLEAHGPVMEPARQSGSVADDTLRLGQLVVEALHREDDQLSSSPISSEATDHGDAFENLTAVATRQEESQNAAATSSSEEAIGASVGVAESGQGYTEGEREFGEEEDEEIEALSTELQSTTARGDQATAATAVYGGLTDPEESLTEDAATMPLMGAAFSGDGQESKGGESTAAGALAEQQISNPESAVDVDGLSESLHSAGPMDSEQGECVEERVVETVMYSEAILLDEGQGEDVSEVEPDSMLEAGELQTAGTASPQHPAAMEEKPGRALDDGVEAVSSSTASRHSIPISTRLSDSPRLENEQTRLNTVDPDVKKHRLDTPFSHGELDEAMDPSRVTTEADRPVESLSPGDGRRVTAGNLSSRGEECSSKSERSLVDRDDQIRGSVVVEADVDRFEGISIPPSAAEEEVADAGVGSQGRRGSAEKLRESVLDTVYSRYANNNAAGMTAITTISDFCPDIRSAAEFDPDEYVRRIEDGPGPSPAERRLIRHAFLSGYDDALLAVERGELLENTDRVREEPSAAYVDLHPQTSAPLHNTVRSPSTPHRSTAEAPLLASQLNRSNDTTESELSFQLDDAPVCSSEKHDEGLAIGDSNSPSRPVTDQHLPASTIRDSSSRVALKSSFLEVPVTIPLSRRKFINGRPRHHKSRISCL